MFVYIFCIVWVTLFVFLAECQFKKVPIKEKRNKPKNRFMLRKGKKKDIVQNDDNADFQRTNVPDAFDKAMIADEDKVQIKTTGNSGSRHYINKNNKIDVVDPVVILPKGQGKQGDGRHKNEHEESLNINSVSRGRRIIEIVQYEDIVKKEKGSIKSHIVGNEISRGKKIDMVNQKIGKKVLDAKNAERNISHVDIAKKLKHDTKRINDVKMSEQSAKKLDDIKTLKHNVKKIDDVKTTKNYARRTKREKTSKNNLNRMDDVKIQGRVNDGDDENE